MATTTLSALRDFIATTIGGLTPTVRTKDRFLAHRNDRDGDFVEWLRSKPEACFRRFQVRDSGDREPPDVTNTDVWNEVVTLVILVAYPQTVHAGKAETLSRDDCMEADRLLIEKNVGLIGFAGFQGANPNACWLGSATSRQKLAGVDLLAISQRMQFYRAAP